MTQRLPALITPFILNIAFLFACTSPEADVGDRTTNDSDIVSGSDQDPSTEDGPQDNGGSSDATDSSDPHPSETESGSLEQGVCEDSFSLECGAQLRVNSDEGAANIEYHSACDDTFRFP